MYVGPKWSYKCLNLHKTCMVYCHHEYKHNIFKVHALLLSHCSKPVLFLSGMRNFWLLYEFRNVCLHVGKKLLFFLNDLKKLFSWINSSAEDSQRLFEIYTPKCYQKEGKLSLNKLPKIWILVADIFVCNESPILGICKKKILLVNL